MKDKLRTAVRTGYCLMMRELDNIKPTNDYNRRILRELKRNIIIINDEFKFDENPESRFPTE